LSDDIVMTDLEEEPTAVPDLAFVLALAVSKAERSAADNSETVGCAKCSWPLRPRVLNRRAFPVGAFGEDDQICSDDVCFRLLLTGVW